MTLLLVDSFDWLRTAPATNISTSLTEKWTLADASWDLVTGRNGLGLHGSSTTTRVSRAFAGAERDDLLVCGFAAKWPTSVPSGNQRLIQFRDNEGNYLEVRTTTQNQFRVLRAESTQIAISPQNAFQRGVWHYFEWKARLSNSTTDLVIRIDGVPLSLTGSPWDTLQGTATLWDEVRIYHDDNNDSAPDIDDFYVLNEQGSENNDFLGDVRIICLRPDGNGNSSQFTGSDGNSTDNYLLVDEVVTDDDTTYVESGTDDQKDTYSFETLTGSGSVFAVQHMARAKRTDTDSRDIALVSRLSTATPTEADSADQALAATYAGHRVIWPNDPEGLDWSISKVNSAEFGQKSRPT